MDVKFKNSLCNCAPTKIEGFGRYQWEPELSRLQNIPDLPKVLFDLIKKTNDNDEYQANGGGETNK